MINGRSWTGSSEDPQHFSYTIFKEGELITVSGNGAITKSFRYQSPLGEIREKSAGILRLGLQTISSAALGSTCLCPFVKI